ncbi:MAG: putative lipid II flippase FtsW [Candidatus Omnitrophica bacterium]|nr:putative lipid II flippase FtsW [Candidatus Omnitrophota bacterium]
MREIRISIIVIFTILVLLGVVMVFSASSVYALRELKSSAYFLKRHLFYLSIGIVAMAFSMMFDYRVLAKYAKPLLVFSFCSLILVLIPGIGREVYGARRWFQVFGFSFQPSELTKIAMMIYVADFLARKKKKIENFSEGFLPVMMALGAVCLLILKQPDLGTAVLIGAVVFIMLFVAGARLLHLSTFILMTLPVIYFLVSRVAYRMRRIQAFLDPWKDQQGVGFQLVQSQIALGSGGIFGVGLGKSVQKLYYLPAAHTDFILSIIGEELGLFGTLSVIVLFVLFIWQGARIAKRTEDPFGYFLALGIVVMIGFQAIINVGVIIGAFPTKGLPLPFVSYGGSALIVQMICVGLLLNISRVQDLS